MDLSVRIGSLTLKNPLIAASGCFGYGVEYADTIDLVLARRRRGQGVVPGRTRRSPAAAIVETPAGMLNAIGLQGIGVRRFVDEKMPELRARGATVIVNVCGTTHRRVRRGVADPLGHRGRRRHRAQYLLPEHQGRRHPVRLQPGGNVRRRQCRAEGDPTAAHSQAHAQRHRRRLIRASVRRGGRRRRVAGEHVPRDGHRRRDQTSRGSRMSSAA